MIGICLIRDRGTYQVLLVPGQHIDYAVFRLVPHARLITGKLYIKTLQRLQAVQTPRQTIPDSLRSRASPEPPHQLQRSQCERLHGTILLKDQPLLLYYPINFSSANGLADWHGQYEVKRSYSM